MSVLVPLVSALALLSPPAAARICPTTDVRSELEELDKLRNCTVIMGDLSIVLLESFEAEEFARYSFPELREISGYFLMLRVFGIRSLGQLFPNLSVIRGNQLFGNYAFILFELLDLKEVGWPDPEKIFSGTRLTQKRGLEINANCAHLGIF